jgi:hypothetical protein
LQAKRNNTGESLVQYLKDLSGFSGGAAGITAV